LTVGDPTGCDDSRVRVAFLGLGLIGGSIALAAHSPERSIMAWSPRGTGPAEALAAGAIDAVAPSADAAVRGADLVVLAAPPADCITLLTWLGSDGRSALRIGATITDVASTKRAVTEAARAARVPFVGGHPMAGREASGFTAASADLLRDRPWVVTEAVEGGDPAVVEELAVAVGARPLHMTSAAHDDLVAAISHLPLLTSVALVEAVLGTGEEPDPTDVELLRALAATGWRDTTRLARGDPDMATGIATTNGAALAARLRAYRARLDEWLAQLEAPGGPDPTVLGDRFAEARRRLQGGER
jgi:prephenate dehydrogenase